ncbi:tripartite tricarboxylate transporter substrate binding protein [Verticiella sediminum]|uniref:Tripartite tricarboxylate transporter substrate binding protein n=1 Tax=Verticiella sediminum TaxID=1247510 RepID=A0A556AUW6_9BURK|nr:tripartite tricarboxylate transporter substrate binding protein [Verticiella sediminum]TSH96739.1 tripartite tricarboxylate transporter substrate binding protein [Verticiella sediminum]
MMSLHRIAVRPRSPQRPHAGLRRAVAALTALAVAAPLAILAPAAAQAAEDWPRRPIRMLVPFPAGSATDGAARLIADALREPLGQTVIIENPAGADGIIAAQQAKRAKPDGYTLFMSTNSAHAANRMLYDDLPYDPQKDFTAVSGLIQIPLAVLVREDFPADDLAGFVSVARQRAASNKPLAYGSGNTSSLVAGELLKHSTGIDMINVPYRGNPQAMQDLVAGQIDVIVGDPYSSMAFLTSGRMKALAVTASERHPLLPQVPTTLEAGHPDVQVITWAALFAPTGTDEAIVQRLNQEINRVLDTPDFREKLLRMAMTPMIMSPRELTAFVDQEIIDWETHIQLANVPRKSGQP